jgi:dCTP deaminase
VTETAGILSDESILHAIRLGDIEIDPFDPANVNPVSVDLTLGDTFLVYADWVYPPGPNDHPTGRIQDVREKPETIQGKIASDGLNLKPGVGYLMHTRERVFTKKYVPVLDGKSSMGRLFMQVHVTAGFGDPGFNGQYTLEVTVVHPLRVYAGMRIAQMRFHTICGAVVKPYAGNYVGEDSRGPVASKAYKQFLSK